MGSRRAFSQEVSRARLMRPLGIAVVEQEMKKQSCAFMFFRVSPSTFLFLNFCLKQKAQEKHTDIMIT